MTKRYLLFAGQSYYPDGGWMDYQGAFDEMQEAIEKGATMHADKKTYVDWWHVMDLLTGQCVSANDEWTIKEINGER